MPDVEPPTRPDPRELLARIADAPEGPGRGRHKIFFGMAPGVGKTYAMLASAQRLASSGLDVAVGVVETHGRAETERMLLGLDLLPRRSVDYCGTVLAEFDAEAAIARRPDVLLVDELAHTNAPGSARGKRWQDIEQCLAAGIDVHSTLNVQHLESLGDVIAQITGVRVSETVPDHVFDQADEIELVDLPVEALHDRLRAGRVYLGEHADRAVDPTYGFFRKGNLTALRELALRRTAAWVDSELRKYKRDRGIRVLWPAGERIVVAISPSPTSGRLIRAAKRMAAGLHADLLAVYVETPRTAGLSAADRERLDANVKLAESLGATTTTLAGNDASRELIAFARASNVGKIVVGKSDRPRWKDLLFGSFVDQVIRQSGDIDIYVVRGDDAGGPAEAGASRERTNRGRANPQRYAIATMLVIAVTLLGIPAGAHLELTNIAMIYLAAVVVCAIWLGRGPSILAAIAGVAALDFCFVAPRWSFAVSDIQYLLTFAVMLAVGLIIGTLTSRIREQVAQAWTRQRATAAQYALSRELASARDAREVAAIVARHTHDLLLADAVVCVPRPRQDGGVPIDVLASAGSPDWFTESPDRHEQSVAAWALDHGTAAGLGTRNLPSSIGRYTPLIGASGVVGLLGIRRASSPDSDAGTPFSAGDLETLTAIAAQAASALERVHLAEARHAAQLDAERERLRNALLSSVSHDLRTPLASITGAASTLEQSAAIDSPTRSEMLRTIIGESSRLSDIIANLIFATRLESGAVALRREWTTVEEVVGVGLARHRAALAARAFRATIPADLPMIRVDNAMLPQVIHNLIENALRYSPQAAAISLDAWTADGRIVIQIADEGPGLAEDEASKVFERFYRGRSTRGGAVSGGTSTGMGLGLTICDGIIRAHGGRIWAQQHDPRGVAFLFAIPIEHPQPVTPSDPGPVSGTTP